MKYFLGITIFIALLVVSACRTDFETVPSTGQLEFSKDTVYLDTVFTNIGSSTYTLKVYNNSKEDIAIPTISLENGQASFYRLNVDGVPGRSFENITLLAEDSLFVFVETTLDINNLPTQGGNTSYLYTDKILFDSGALQQDVDLVTLVQDAHFLFPAQNADGTIETLSLGMDADGNEIRIEGFFLESNQLQFTNEKPYVIYGYAAVPPGETLQIEAGARLHFHENSGILVANTASIQANGLPSTDPELLENEIIFEGDRLEPEFSDIPGQWGTIWLTQGSTNNNFNHTTIKNSIVGILMDSNDGDRTLTLENVQIYNSANVGLLARTANIYGENVVINNAGQTALACSLGGTYEFNHCTFANYWTQSFRSFPALQIDNFLPISDTQILVEDLTQATFRNCIIYGNEMRELSLINASEAAFNFEFENCLIRFEDPNGDFSDNPDYDFTNVNLYPSTLLNADPNFQNTALNNFNIEQGTSAAEGIGNTQTAIQVPIDLNGVTRDTNAPDAGAYESIVFPDPDN